MRRGRSPSRSPPAGDRLTTQRVRMVWVAQLNEYTLYMVSSQLGTDGCSHPRFSPHSQLGQPASGPSQTHSGAHPWHQNSHDTAGSSVAMEVSALKWYTKSGNGHCLVQLLCRCSTKAVESSGLNWMIKPLGQLCGVTGGHSL